MLFIAWLLGNQVKGLDDDEAAFLNFVSSRQMEAESARRKEEDAALEEYRVCLVMT